MIRHCKLLSSITNLCKLTHNLSGSRSFICPVPFEQKLISCTSITAFTSVWRIAGFYKDLNFIEQFSSIRCYCHNAGGHKEWTEEIEYLDESGSILYKGKGIRSVEPGIDDHVVVGEVKKPSVNAAAVAKIVEVVKRWKWGPELETQLDKLQFVPNMTHIVQSLKIISDSDACLSLFRDFDGIQSLFDEMVGDSTSTGAFLSVSCNRVIQYLANVKKLEVSFCCFKKIQEAGGEIDTETYNSLITLFFGKGLPYKAFEIYESMEKASCSWKGSENGDTVNYATVVREVKAYLKKGVAAKELQSHIAAFPVSAQEKMNALLEGLFDGVEKVFGKEATKRKNHLAGAVAGDDEGSQLLLLNAAEEFCYKKGSNELNEVALIPKALYDVDLVEEEHVMHWYSKGLKGDKKDSQVWKNAQPFIDWLRNAESESEEE
ncbi:hypothetical protein HN51_002075 [Arachis hypogaea]